MKVFEHRYKIGGVLMGVGFILPLVINMVGKISTPYIHSETFHLVGGPLIVVGSGMMVAVKKAQDFETHWFAKFLLLILIIVYLAVSAGVIYDIFK